MNIKNSLTELQRKQLSILEPQLRSCVKSANLDKAKDITIKLQTLLRPTGHETRLLQAKNWLYETALEAGALEFAKSGFKGNIAKSSNRTRINLEASALLAICFLREKNISEARVLIFNVVDNINNIVSESRRKQFHERLLQRLEEESILSGLIGYSGEVLDLDEVNNETVSLVMKKSENEILENIGCSVPPLSIDLLEQVQDAYMLRLPAPDRILLPKPLSKDKKIDLGKRTSSALKRVAWRALCSPDSEIYKAWSQGLSVVYDKKYIAGAIVSAFNYFSISITMLAASIAALAIKFGSEVFCEIFAPKSLMIDKKDKN
ncbi:hypothetical protein ACFFL1_05845 [Samsonia erythrinae]|uniref:Uncharacterized protein n=1 Tax=Samsonia erythrinae TaxID=160434 RepID=A0A4R3VFG0_9GAMM|nr:hypothetical protein [Samsonia erythrinae]TCV04157.1 hypothetical protein EDC54_11125 [Samsonia erythrinae]